MATKTRPLSNPAELLSPFPFIRRLSVRALAFILPLLPVCGAVADDKPTISPYAVFETEDGEEEGTEYSGNAPLTATFYANPSDVGEYTAYYEWHFTLEGDDEPYLIRYDEDTEYTFTEAGSHTIELYATFVNGTDTVFYTEDYWENAQAISVTISESYLDMPNAFSPNGDGINDVYKAKEGYQSIVEFHAWIFNRWGKVLFEWTDPEDGWDGTYKGKDVADGVYFVKVNAKGADGIKYTFKRDVNLLRGYTETTE